jgi:hypothetical protein
MLDGMQEIQLDLLASCPTFRGTDDDIRSAIPIANQLPRCKDD